MSYTYRVNLGLGVAKTGLVLSASLYDDAMNPVPGLVSSIAEASGNQGNYGAVHTVPGSDTGFIRYTDGGGNEVGLVACEPPPLAALDYTAPDNATIGTIASNVTTLLSRIGAFTGAGVNTVLGFLKAVMSKTATLPSDVGGTFDPATDSEEAIRDRGDAAWASSVSAAAVWSYIPRTLTNPSALDSESLAAGTLSRRRGDDWSISITGLGNITARTKLWMTIKRNYGDADTAAIVQWVETTGLARLNGAAGTAGHGSLTVTNATTGAITVTLQAADSATIALASNLSYDVQVLSGGVVSTLAEGTFIVTGDVTRATS